MSHEVGGDIWTDWASAWPARRAERGEVVDDLIVAFAARHLTGRVLDAGCGDGAYTARLAAPRPVGPGLDACGVDGTADLVTLARTAHPHLSFGQADLAALPFADDAFGGVLCLTVLEWVARPLESLRELVRVTRPGGTLVLGVLGAGNRTRDLHLARFWGESPMNGLLPWELALLCGREGLTVTDSLGVGREGRVTSGVTGERDAMTRAMIWLLAVSSEGGSETQLRGV